MTVLTPARTSRPPRTQSEQQLWNHFRASRDPEIREELVCRYLSLARRLATRYHYASEPLDDLLQVANLGLLKAIDRFDPSRESGFVAFATPTILGELKRHFRDRSWTVRVPRGIHDLTGKIDKATEKLTVDLQRSPTVIEIAERLGVSALDVLEALEASHNRRPISLDRPIDNGEGEEQSEEWLGKDDPGFEQVEDRLAMRSALPTLDLRQGEVLRLRFIEELSQTQIAERIGYSQMHVSRILRGAVQQLRESATTP
jgi:RNA polymerase sigma-B factor